MTPMTRDGYEIDEVTLNPALPAELAGFNIELPRRQTSGTGYLLDVAGWVAGRGVGIERVYLNIDGSAVSLASLGVPRPDVRSAFPDLDVGERCGFRALVALPGLPEQFNLRLFALTDTGSAFWLGEIAGSRRFLPEPAAPNIRPALVTSLGRTGTSWLMHLLAQHPEVVSYPRWGYELSASGYWMKMFRASIEHPHGLPNASSYAQWEGHSWWGGQDPFELPGTSEWFARENVEAMADVCRERIDAYYEWLARRHSIAEPHCWIEKTRPDHEAGLLRELYPEAREIVLVRDFRDMVCSILAFNERRGYAAFDRDQVSLDEEYPALLGPAVRALLSVTQRRPDAVIVRYEDLVADPRGQLERILRHLGLDVTAASLGSVLARASERTGDMAEHQTSVDSKASVGRWQREMSPALVAACEEAFGDALDAFGYR